MKKLYYYSLLALLSLGCQRAQDETPIPPGKGALQIELRLDNGVAEQASKATVQDPYVVTKQELAASVLQDKKVVASWDPISEMPPVVYLEPGNYTFELQTRGARQAVNATPYYFGQTPFEVKAGLVSSIYANAVLKSLVVSMTLQGGWAVMDPYKLTCFALDKPETTLFQTTDKAARLYIDTPFPYGLKVEGRVGGVSKKSNVLVYDHLEVGTYHHLTLSDQ